MKKKRWGNTDEWFDYPMRWAQLTLVETDSANFNLEFWLDYFKRIKADAACLSAGGYIAYYPTKIPMHYRSMYLGDNDTFGDLVEGCRKMDMVVIARTDPHAVHQDVYDAHPDWIAVNENGDKRRHWSMHNAWVTCALGPYNFEYMTEIHKEIMNLYQVEGIFSNRWTGSGVCYCEYCRRGFRNAYGMEIPRSRDPIDPAWRNYLIWREQRLFDLYDLWDKEVRTINPWSRYIPNSGGGALTELNMREIGKRADTLFADRQARRGVMPPWANGKNGKEFRAALGQRPIGGIFSMGVEEQYRWKDSVQNPAEMRIWIADGIANGLRPWFTKFAAILEDRRWLDTVEELYNWAYRSEKYLRNERPLAQVAMVFSQQTAKFYGGEQAKEKVENHTLGWYQVLVEARIPFEMVHDELLDLNQISKFKTLILPNIAALSDKQCEQIRDYVKQGGSVIATYETSLYDEFGNRRGDFGLADLFGVHYKGSEDGPMKNAYLRLEDEPKTGARHQILKGLQDTNRIIHGLYRLNVEPDQEFETHPLTLIPTFPDLPMEEVYARETKTNISEVFLKQVGEGRVIYFNWDIDRVFWELLNCDHGKILRNAVEWVTNEPSLVEVSGAGILDISVWQQKDSVTVNLVNLTNPMMMKGPIREILPVGGQRLRLRLPNCKTPKKVQLLRSGQSPQYHIDGHYLELSIPSIVDLEIVAVDL